MSREEAVAQVRAAPKDAGAWVRLAQVLQAEGEPGKAHEAYNRALALEPSLGESRPLSLQIGQQGSAPVRLPVAPLPAETVQPPTPSMMGSKGAPYHEALEKSGPAKIYRSTSNWILGWAIFDLASAFLYGFLLLGDPSALLGFYALKRLITGVSFLAGGFFLRKQSKRAFRITLLLFVGYTLIEGVFLLAFPEARSARTPFLMLLRVGLCYRLFREYQALGIHAEAAARGMELPASSPRPRKRPLWKDASLAVTILLLPIVCFAAFILSAQ